MNSHGSTELDLEGIAKQLEVLKKNPGGLVGVGRYISDYLLPGESDIPDGLCELIKVMRTSSTTVVCYCKKKLGNDLLLVEFTLAYDSDPKVQDAVGSCRGWSISVNGNTILTETDTNPHFFLLTLVDLLKRLDEVIPRLKGEMS